jgi:FkbM family methyltransferase
VFIGRFVHRTFRGILEAKGYWVRHQSVLPFGIDYQHDISRLSRLFGSTVDTFFDVGANTGQTASAVLDKFPEASVFAFEPDEKSFAALTANVRSSRLQCFNVAMSDKSGEARFFDYGPLATCNSLVKNSQYAMRSGNQATTRTVECETIDGFCGRSGVEHVDVLKVDTEGHELAVLHGAKRMLVEGRVQFIYIEFNTLIPSPGTHGGALMPISEVLEPAGFRFVATYPEYMITEGELFVTSNALFTHALV